MVAVKEEEIPVGAVEHGHLSPDYFMSVCNDQALLSLTEDFI